MKRFLTHFRLAALMGVTLATTCTVASARDPGQELFTGSTFSASGIAVADDQPEQLLAPPQQATVNVQTTEVLPAEQSAPAVAVAAAPVAIAVAPARETFAIRMARLEAIARRQELIQRVIGHAIANDADGGGFSGFPGPGFGHFGRGAAGDLELVEVAMLGTGEGDAPSYRVSFRNNSNKEIGDFRVSLIAVLGRLNPSSPVVTVDAPTVPAGGVATLDIALPGSCLAMGFDRRHLAPFDRLVVMIDSFDEWVEASETNNLSVAMRDQIAMIEVQIAAPAVVEGTDEALTESIAPQSPAVTLPGQPTPRQDIDFDQLQTEDPAEAPAIEAPAVPEAPVGEG